MFCLSEVNAKGVRHLPSKILFFLKKGRCSYNSNIKHTNTDIYKSVSTLILKNVSSPPQQQEQQTITTTTTTAKTSTTNNID